MDQDIELLFTVLERALQSLLFLPHELLKDHKFWETWTFVRKFNPFFDWTCRKEIAVSHYTSLSGSIAVHMHIRANFLSILYFQVYLHKSSLQHDFTITGSHCACCTYWWFSWLCQPFSQPLPKAPVPPEFEQC